MKIFLTGACGYKGSVLVPKLLKAGHQVVAFDIMWFGNFLEPHPDLTVVKGDVRNPDEIDLTGIDAIVHLSSVANDPCGDLDPKLTWEISCLATMQLADRAVRHGVKRQIVRPATVCGFSPRQRLDVSVNMLTMQALMNGRITVFGGNQTRPNIHIDDITDLYLFLLDHPEHTGIYNAGFENISILDIANMVAKHVKADVIVTPSNDPRSYRVNSDRLLATGFRPKKTVEDAIKEIIGMYSQGQLKNEDRWYNLKWMEKDVVK